MTAPLHPDVHVRLSGEDGNSMFIIGRARQAARRAGLTNEQLDSFTYEAMSGDYDNVLRTVMKWFSTS